jgi:hypothetical protein
MKKNHLNLWLLAIAAVTSMGSPCKADNPIVQTHYTADPAPMAYRNSVYIYTGEDVPGTGFYYMTRWRVYSSSDMVNWTDHGSPLSLETFSWAHDRAWAAQCVERNGKFYWYVCVQSDKNDMSIGVAVSDKPTGPFKDAIGKPLIQNGSWSNIDPTVFVDTDGQAYMYWGNGSLFYVKLNADMISYSGDIVTVPLTTETFGGSRANRDPNTPNKDMFVEAPWFFKRNNHYYQMFAGMDKGAECLSYSMSDGPTGPWKYVGRCMVGQKTNSFTNHGGFVDFKGHSYLVYHTALLPGGGSYGRSAAVEEFQYLPDGTIPSINISKEGPKPIGTINPYQRVEAETIAYSEKCSTDQDNLTGVYVSDIKSKGYLKVRSVDFGNTSPKTFSASLAAGLSGGTLEVRIDSLTGPKLCAIDVNRTGGWKVWKTFSAAVAQPTTGVHDVFFCFNGKNLTAGRNTFNFDFWKMNR